MQANLSSERQRSMDPYQKTVTVHMAPGGIHDGAMAQGPVRREADRQPRRKLGNQGLECLHRLHPVLNYRDSGERLQPTT